MPVGLLPVHLLVDADLEREQQVAARREHPVQLGEDGRLVGGGHVDQRVPPQGAGQRPVGQAERGERTDLEVDVGVRPRATSTMAGERSTPNASSPRPRR